MQSKDASSQAAWALLMEGIAQARVETHRAQHLLNRALRLIEDSEKKEYLHQVAGDIIQALPQRLDRTAVILDRTGLALSKMGEEFLEARLSIADKNMVDEAIESAFGKGSMHHSAVSRISLRYLKKKVG